MACLDSYVFTKHRALLFHLGISICSWICLGWRKDELSNKALGKLRTGGWSRGGQAALSPPGIRQANGEIMQANLSSPRAIIPLYMFESLWGEKDLWAFFQHLLNKYLLNPTLFWALRCIQKLGLETSHSFLIFWNTTLWLPMDHIHVLIERLHV